MYARACEKSNLVVPLQYAPGPYQSDSLLIGSGTIFRIYLDKEVNAKN
jgi:hypothetical protein